MGSGLNHIPGNTMSPRVASLKGSLRSLWLLLIALILLDALILGAAWLLHLQVVPGWKKGPLIDPAAPYAPEQAILAFAWATCLIVDLYVLITATVGRRLRAWWVPWTALLLSLSAAETGIQIWLSMSMVTYFRPHPTLHWVVRPDLQGFKNRTGGGTLTTNADGMRNASTPREKPSDAFRILILGDSSNFGHGVDDLETNAAVLESLLADRVPGRSVQVLNGACPGWTTYQAVRFLQETGLRYRPDLVVAGFNNDPGPDYFGDAEREPGAFLKAIERPLFHSELFLLGKETLLSTLRRVVPAPSASYSARIAGSEAIYGSLSAKESQGLRARVSLQEFLGNLEKLHQLSSENQAELVWLNMPYNRLLPTLTERYVNPAYRVEAERLSQSLDFPLVDVDKRWLLTREYGLHQEGHVHHPSPAGHARLAEQLADFLVESGRLPGATGRIPISGPPPVDHENVLRLALSASVPLDVALAMVLEEHPELFRDAGWELELQLFDDPRQLQDHVAAGLADAVIARDLTMVPALEHRGDLFVVASLGSSGRVAILARRDRVGSLSELRGRRVAIPPELGSTDWLDWGARAGAIQVPMEQGLILEALLDGRVDAALGWDPAIALYQTENPERLHILEHRSTRSLLAVGIEWAAQDPKRAARLTQIIAEALRLTAANLDSSASTIAARTHLPPALARELLTDNDILSGKHKVGATNEPLRLGDPDRQRLGAIHRCSTCKIDELLGLELLSGRIPRIRTAGASPSKPTRDVLPGSSADAEELRF